MTLIVACIEFYNINKWLDIFYETFQEKCRQYALFIYIYNILVISNKILGWLSLLYHSNIHAIYTRLIIVFFILKYLREFYIVWYIMIIK